MIPAIFRAESLHAVERRAGHAAHAVSTDQIAAAHIEARRDSAAVIGISSAVGALGGFFIPRLLGASIKATGGASTAFGLFLACYLVCVAVTWWSYLRVRFMTKRVPSLAQANA